MSDMVKQKFAKMGARVNVAIARPPAQRRTWNNSRLARFAVPAIRVDVRRDERGEFFDVQHRKDVRVEVIDVRPADRHLLLLVREPGRTIVDDHKSKFLCGHDERSWFVAAIPESAEASNVQDAKDALKPQAVWDAMRDLGVSMNERDRRKTKAFVRQGEWFFIPRPHAGIDFKHVLRNEPIRRGAGKPHMCQFLFRMGGERVHVCSSYPNGLTDAEFAELTDREKKRWDWRLMVREARVFVKGAIRHPDHATIWLQTWHEVVMNTETQARAMQHVAFLD
jgi:hypothetical protein